MQTITPSLWFDGQAEEAAAFYVSVFDDSRVTKIARYGSAGPGPEGSVMTVDLQIRGQDVNMINGGPEFTFTEAISLVVSCADQAEVDRYWEALSDGGETGPCGWLKDRYGLSWQVVPVALNEMLDDPDEARAQRVMAAMLQMSKLDVAELRRAYERTDEGVPAS